MSENHGNDSSTESQKEQNTGKLEKPHPLEALLLDKQGPEGPVDDVTAREVVAVSHRRSRSPFFLILFALVGCAFIAGGFFFYGQSPSPPADIARQSAATTVTMPVPERPVPPPAAPAPAPVATPVAETPVLVEAVVDPAPEPVEKKAEVESRLFTVLVGPFINTEDLDKGISALQAQGFLPEKRPGRGAVTMLRLLEGVYPPEQGRERLQALQAHADSAFVLPENGQLAVYAGSFHDVDRARRFADELAAQGVEVSLVNTEITMDGTSLVALQADKETAEQVAAHINGLGLHARIEEE